MKKQNKTIEVKPLTAKEIKSLPVRAQKAIKGNVNEEEDDEEEGGKIVNILRLYNAGVPAKFIVRLGFNKSTVYRQVGELKKLRKAPALSYYGFELFEARVQRVMKAKGLTHQAAVESIINSDIEKD